MLSLVKTIITVTLGHVMRFIVVTINDKLLVGVRPWSVLSCLLSMGDEVMYCQLHL